MSDPLGRPIPRIGETKVCDMHGVHELSERFCVPQLWRTAGGRLVIRAYNEGGNNYTDLDLWSLVEWLEAGPIRMGLGSDE